MSNTIMVSVVMITYKHEAYITQAIEGVLMQETNFEYELIIADDCSPDKTEEVVRNIISTHPKGHNIKYFRHDTNIGMQPNGIFALQQCKGKYVAICEGDDYWTDPLKLQKQVDFLEGNEDVICVTHNVQIVHGKDICSNFPGLGDTFLSTRDVLFERDYNYLPTGSYVFRQSFFERNTSNLQKYVDFGDWPIIFQLSLLGDVYHMQDVLGVYRKHSGGYTFVNKSSIQLRINNFYLAVGILYPEYWNDCQAKMKMLENKIYIQREKELKSEEYIVNNNGLKKLFRIFYRRFIVTVVSPISKKRSKLSTI